MFHLYEDENCRLPINRINHFSLIVSQLVLFFDGAAQNRICAVGGMIYLNDNHYFSVRLNCGMGSNMKAELMVLWCVLRMANLFGSVNIKVFGDSAAEYII